MILIKQKVLYTIILNKVENFMSLVFYNLPFETVYKSLKLFEKETGKIQVFEIDRDKYSVKFI